MGIAEPAPHELHIAGLMAVASHFDPYRIVMELQLGQRYMRSVWPNVELTGRRRCDALAARRMMNQNCLAASAARRWRSG
jgi:hypothetical protein